MDAWEANSFWGNVTAVTGKYEIDMAPERKPVLAEHAARGVAPHSFVNGLTYCARRSSRVLLAS